MSANGEPDWLGAVRRSATVRRAIILYGNVGDVFYDAEQRQHVSLCELLRRTFTRDRALGFTMAGVWDQADGLRFDDGRTLNRFHDAVRQRLGGAQPTGGQAYDLGDNGRRNDQAPGILYASPNELLPAIRAVITGEQERPAFILDWTHYLVTQAAHPDPDDRRWMLQLGKAVAGEPVVVMDSDHLRTNGGLIVLLTRHLGSVPPMVYQGDPRICLISVPTPSRPERKAFFVQHGDDLRCRLPQNASASSSIATGRATLADTLADLTDQHTFTDLQQILSLAMHTPEELAPDRLLNLYRLGEQRSPWEELNEDKLRGVEEALKRRVVGQDEAVRHMGTTIIRAHMGLAELQPRQQGKPKGVGFLVGPPGVGKTELAKAAAEFVFGDEACIRFDMSEYNHEHSDARFVGAPPGYVGFEEGGQLTNAVRQRPFSVLLFDEIEKAHGRILDKFLQILSDGRLTDGRGETAYFSESVIIFTSNIGAADMPASDDPEVIRGHFVRAVRDYFVNKLGRPELLNRIGGNIVVFQPIKDAGFRQAILDRKLAPLSSHLRERFGIELRIPDELRGRFVEGASAEEGGRGLVNALERDLLNPLARFLFERKHQLRRGRIVVATPAEAGLQFDLQEA